MTVSDQQLRDIRCGLEELRDFHFRWIANKLASERYAAWPNHVCEAAERDYRRFLALSRALPTVALVPSFLVDEFWHLHILNTRRYAEDCGRFFGYLLHHLPAEVDASRDSRDQLLRQAYDSQQLWREVFGEDLYGELGSNSADAAAKNHLRSIHKRAETSSNAESLPPKWARMHLRAPVVPSVISRRGQN